MRVEQTFSVRRPPEVVFDYLTNPSNLAEWQTSKTSVEQLTDGPPRLGTRVRERTKGPGGREFEQLVEFTEFVRPSSYTCTSSRVRTRSTGRGPSSRTATGRGFSSSPKASCAAS
jgi:uncharacterized protein YndB with AHSA1/START domain